MSLNRTICMALAAIALCLQPTHSAYAAGGDKKPGATSNRVQATFESMEEEDEPGQGESDPAALDGNPRAVILPTMALPVHADGYLANYFFVQVTILVKDGVNPWQVRDKTPFIRQAILMEAHRQSIADPSSARLDEETARAAILAALESVLQEDVAESVLFTGFDPMHAAL